MTKLSFIHVLSDYGLPSPELVTVKQSTFFGMFLGAAYGGFTYSRYAYLDFMERNQATTFTSHLEAKVNDSNKTFIKI